MKTTLTVSIESEKLEVIKHFCDVSGVPISKLYADHTDALYNTIKLAGLDKKKKYCKLDLVKMFVKGARQPIG